MQFSAMTAEEQVRATTESSILITGAGGGALTGMFLDRGSSILLFYDDTGKDASNSGQFDYPARLDWDYFDNCAYLRVSWIPIKGLDEPAALESFVKMVAAEIEGQQLMRIDT